jgi:hypothetical protein
MAERIMSGTKIRIRIVTQDGRPVSDASVTVVRSTVPFPEIALIPDADGIVDVLLPPGSFTFRAHGPFAQQGEATVTRPGTEDEIVQIVIR